MNVPPPCGKDCPNRTLGCHSTCEKFVEWDKRRRKIKSEINKQREIEWRNFNGR